MRTLAIVPARGGSKRVLRKNLRPLGGQSLVARAIECALGAATVDRVVLSSEDEEILAVGRGFGEDIALPRPAEIAGDTSPAVDYVNHALAALEAAGAGPYDAFVILPPTSPLRLPADVDATVSLLERTGADTAVSVVQVAHDVHPIKLKTLDGDRLLPFLEEERGRRMIHQLPTVYVRNCAVYASRRRVLASGDVIGADCRAHVMPRERSVDINDELDLLFAEFLLERSARAVEGP